ncbi:tyrosine-type recombinase/integrase [Uliginosibacterium sp. TH139]|uniref:tyrosine-type recombinase/integrase n=1 Tax=Uliginosibacterium sp. TH139 TaxID=2067453 RepID=UPI0013042A36|nr:tyrosine-type recombinase/integrase [Uliginosibacterium sp. TH139]
MTRDVDSFYCYCGSIYPEDSLDAILSTLDFAAIEVALDGFFLTLTSKKHRTMCDEQRWRTVLEFVRFVLTWTGTKATQIEVSILFKKLKRLEARYAQLRVHRKRKPAPLRSLPASVVQSVYGLLSPDSAANPFRTESLRWCSFVLFLMFLTLGLRRGEILALPVDCLKEQFDDRSDTKRFWISIKKNHYSTNDVRHTTPSIKTSSSIRQIPVGAFVASSIQCYIENYRGKCDHTYLINSQHGKPMSAEAVARIFRRLTASIPKNELKKMEDRIGKTTITPHDLRHTCAVNRLTTFLENGDSAEIALQKLRVFFGWTPGSTMPVRYARSVFENSLQDKLDSEFDTRVNSMRLTCGHDQ